MILFTILTLALAVGFVPLLLRDTARAEERARMRELTRPMRQAFEQMARTIGINLAPAMRRMGVVIADMAAAMQKVDVVFTAAGQRLADEAEVYVNQENR